MSSHLRSGMLGPYCLGLGKKSKRRQQNKSDGDSAPGGSSPSENFSSPEPTSPSPAPAPSSYKRRVTPLEIEIIPQFDPGQKTNVKGWLHKIDQLGDLYEWDDRDKIFAMQVRLRGAARAWYDDLEDYGASWDSWKERLSQAFPRSTEYVDRLEEMLARKKENGETMTKYYHDKMSLLKKCEISGDAAISCIVRGLPVELRANAKAFCSGDSTPEKLYYGFLSSLEDHKTQDAEPKTTWRRALSDNIQRSPKTCYNCRKTGHEARDCRILRCQICRRLGHNAAACWHNAAPASSTNETTMQPALYQTRPIQKVANNPASSSYRGTRQVQDGRMLQLPGPAPSTNF